MKIEPAKKVRAKKPKVKIDPKFIAAARELRDRYLEEVNERGFRLEARGKYEFVRGIAGNTIPNAGLLLDAA